MSVPVRINGHLLHLLFDTGCAAQIALFNGRVEGLGVQKVGSTSLSGAGGSEKSAKYRASSVTFGEQICLDKVPIYAIAAKPTGADGIIGPSLLKGYKITIDFRAATLVLTRSSLDHPQLSKFGESITLPLNVSGDQIYLPVRRGKAPECMMLDTASSMTMFSSDAITGWDRLPAAVTPDAKNSVSVAPGGAIGNEKINVQWNVGVHDLGLETTQSRFLLSEAAGILTSSHVDRIAHGFKAYPRRPLIGIFGMPFLLQFERVVLDYESRKITLAGELQGNFLRFPRGGLLITPYSTRAVDIEPGATIDLLFVMGSMRTHPDAPIATVPPVRPTPGAADRTVTDSDLFSQIYFPDGGKIAAPAGVMTDVPPGAAAALLSDYVVAVEYLAMPGAANISTNAGMAYKTETVPVGGTATLAGKPIVVPSGGKVTLDSKGKVLCIQFNPSALGPVPPIFAP